MELRFCLATMVLGGRALEAVNSLVPVSPLGIANVTTVTAGGGNTCAMLSGGTIQCWGGNEFGQRGNGTTTDSSVPVTVNGF